MGRVGITSVEFTGAGLLNRGEKYSEIFEVQEIESLDGLSKVRVLDVDIAVRWKDVAYIPTAQIKWKPEKMVIPKQATYKPKWYWSARRRFLEEEYRKQTTQAHMNQIAFMNKLPETLPNNQAIKSAGGHDVK